jgi:hypothetical protein
MKTKIYSLSDPTTGEIRYIGKTISSLERRHHDHVHETKRPSVRSHKSNWIRSILNTGKIPSIELIEYVPDSEWKFWEQYWIAQFKAWGFRLTNKTEGGDDCPANFSMRGRHHTEETKIKLANSQRGKKHSEETRKKQSDLKIGKPLSPEHKLNLFKATGDKWQEIHPVETRRSWVEVKNHDEIARQKISESKKGKPAWNKGISPSDEARKKMSESKKGKPAWNKGISPSEETRLKISKAGKCRSAWNKGIPASVEVRKKMSAAKKRN